VGPPIFVICLTLYTLAGVWGRILESREGVNHHVLKTLTFWGLISISSLVLKEILGMWENMSILTFLFGRLLPKCTKSVNSFKDGGLRKIQKMHFSPQKWLNQKVNGTIRKSTQCNSLFICNNIKLTRFESNPNTVFSIPIWFHHGPYLTSIIRSSLHVHRCKSRQYPSKISHRRGACALLRHTNKHYYPVH
jgi:hypothetical protein